MRVDECMPGDRVHNPDAGDAGTVIAVRNGEVQLRWSNGRRSPYWTSDVEHLERIRERGGKP